MASPIADALTFDDPVNAPDDGDALDAASLIVNTAQPLANRTRNLVNRTGGVSGAGEHAYVDAAGVAAPRSRTITIHPSRGAYGTHWQPGVFGVAPNQGWRISSLVNRGQWFFSLGRNLPDAGLLQSARVMVVPGAVRAASDRMAIHYFETQLSFSAGPPPTEAYNGPLGFAEDDGTTDRQNISLVIGSPLFVSQAAFGQYVIVVTAGLTGAAAPDDIIGLELVFDDPGPINT